MIRGLLEPVRQREQPPKVRDYLSYSAVSTYQTCPLRYYFRYVAGLPEKSVSSSLVFGGAIHRAVEHHFNELLAGNDAPTTEGLLGEYDAAWNEYDPQVIRFGKEDGRDDLQPLALRVLTAFQANPFSRPDGRILGVEEELRGVVVQGCPDILGRIDLVVETPDAVTVTDLKTARSRWSQEQVEESDGQLLLYHELVRSFAPRKQIKLQFAVLTKTKEPVLDLHEVPVSRRRIDRTKRIVERVWRSIEAKHFYPAPSQMNCTGCPFREPCRQWGG